MADQWYMEGPWIKNCNCDPGCPCDFNAAPTHGFCEGVIGMRIDKGNYGDVSLEGLKFLGVAHWPGRIDEGNGDIQMVIDESADEAQREALLTILSGQAGDTMFEIFSAVCPNVKDPVFAPIEFDFDLEARSARVKAGEIAETESETLRGIDPPDPYRIMVTIPGGFEYTGDDNTAETALATKVRSDAEIKLDLSNSHSSLAYVKHSGP